LQAAAAEEVSQDRNIAKSRNLVVNVCNSIIHQAGDHEALAVLQFKFGFSPARTERGHREPRDRERIRKIQRADFGSHLQMDIAVGRDHWGELQANAELLERNGHGCKAGARLDNGERKLASSKETRLFPVYRDEVGLGQNLQQVLVLHRLNHRTKVDVRAENKKVQNVVDALAGAGRATRARSDRLRPEAAKLAGGDRANGVGFAVGDE